MSSRQAPHGAFPNSHGCSDSCLQPAPRMQRVWQHLQQNGRGASGSRAVPHHTLRPPSPSPSTLHKAPSNILFQDRSLLPPIHCHFPTAALCPVPRCWQDRLWEATWLCVTAALWISTSTPSLPEYANLPPAVDVSLHLANGAHGATQGDAEVRANGPLLGRHRLGTEASQKPCSSQEEHNHIPGQVLFFLGWLQHPE